MGVAPPYTSFQDCFLIFDKLLVFGVSLPCLRFDMYIRFFLNEELNDSQMTILSSYVERSLPLFIPSVN